MEHIRYAFFFLVILSGFWFFSDIEKQETFSKEETLQQLIEKKEILETELKNLQKSAEEKTEQGKQVFETTKETIETIQKNIENVQNAIENIATSMNRISNKEETKEEIKEKM